jgi:signal transduction histidine kinase
MSDLPEQLTADHAPAGRDGRGDGPDASGPGAPGWSARALLPANDRAPLTARRLVSTLLVAWGHVEQVELTELVVSELVSNAVRHAGDAGDLELELSADEDTIRLCVADGSDVHPVLRGDPAKGGGGLGLRLVARVAVRWGVEDYVLGKRVWVELPAYPAPARD